MLLKGQHCQHLLGFLWLCGSELIEVFDHAYKFADLIQLKTVQYISDPEAIKLAIWLFYSKLTVMSVHQGQQSVDTVNITSDEALLWVINIPGTIKPPKAKHQRSATLHLDRSVNLFMLQL